MKSRSRCPFQLHSSDCVLSWSLSCHLHSLLLSHVFPRGYLQLGPWVLAASTRDLPCLCSLRYQPRRSPCCFIPSSSCLYLMPLLPSTMVYPHFPFRPFCKGPLWGNGSLYLAYFSTCLARSYCQVGAIPDFQWSSSN